MTHYYNYHYKMPPEIEQLFHINMYHPKVLEWVQTLEPRFCSVHGEVQGGLGWYGARAQCLACKEPDEEEEALYKKEINVSDDIEAKESLTNEKPWFNGMKKFSSVKVNPAPIEEPAPLPLGINVVDSIASGDKIG